MKIKIILWLGGICYLVTVVILIIQGELKEGGFYVAIWPVYLMLYYGSIVFILSLSPLAIPLYWLILPLRKYFIKKGKLTEQADAKIKPFFVSLTLLIALYFNYWLFFPADDGFWSGYKEVTYREPYASAKIIAKDAGYFSECMSGLSKCHQSTI